MTDFQEIPWIEQVLGDYLREHPDLVALDARVAGSTPRTQSLPWVRITQLNADDTSGVEHVIDYLVQLDCYAGADATEARAGQAEAAQLSRTVRALVKAAQGQTLDAAVISRVRFTGDARIPDTDFEPARERYILTASIVAHP